MEKMDRAKESFDSRLICLAPSKTWETVVEK